MTREGPFAEHWCPPSNRSAEARAPGVPSRHVVAAGARVIHGEFIDVLAANTTAGDPLADAMIHAYGTRAPGTMHGELARGLRTGRAPAGAPPALQAFLDACFSPPRDADWDAVDRGASVVARSGVYGLLVLMNASLPLAYTSPAGVKPLVRTGDLLRITGRRLFETLRFVVETAVPGSLRPGGKAWAVTARVRLVHAAVRVRLAASPDWQHGDWGAPINQSDMLGTSLAFSTTFLDGMRRLGFSYTPDDAASVIELWRVSGHWTGVDPALLPRSEAEARRHAAAILATQALPDEDSVALVRALMRVPIFPWSRETYGPLTAFYYALSRGLIGDFYADALQYPRIAPELLLRSYRVAARASDLRRRLPGGDRVAAAVGHQSWKTALAIGLGGKTPQRTGR
jgi:hypothetical protein